MTSLSKDLKAALGKMPKVVSLQWAGNLALMLLAALWLQIPDSHLWQFVLSILSGVLIGLAALWLYAKTVSELRRPTTPPFLRMLLLVLFAAAWLLVLHSIGLLRGKEALFAGFWNSKLPPNLRSFFTYARLLLWQDRFYDLAQWVLAGLLLPLALETSALGLRLTNLKRSSRVYRHWLYWLVVVIAGFVATAVTRALAGWTPGKGVAVETVSLFGRLGIAYSADIFLWCFVLALASIYLEAVES
jgi:hypothetical protein